MTDLRTERPDATAADAGADSRACCLRLRQRKFGSAANIPLRTVIRVEIFNTVSPLRAFEDAGSLVLEALIAVIHRR